ncbi:MAG TPA: hypothetical protein VGN47_09705 [Blastococcus sp.]|jgi:hypothetical protein|nr:hypothetical protein [Blastococcus sp.]
MTHRLHPGAALAALTLAAGLTGCGAAAGSEAAHSSPVPAPLGIGVDGTRFTGLPATVPPGTRTLTFANTTAAVHMAAIARLADGHTAADIVPFLASPAGQQGPPAWLTLVGGVDEIDPGHRGSWTGALTSGHYALVSFSPDAQGRPEVADGMLAPFTVQGATADATPPAPGATVTLAPGAKLTMTAIPAGTTALRLVNDDGTPRTVDITAIRPGRTFDDVVHEAQQGHGVPASLIRLGGTGVPAHGSAVAGMEAATAGTTYVVFDIDHVGEGAIAHETAG